MPSYRTRLDRLFDTEFGINRKDLRPMLAQGRVCVNGKPATEMNQLVQQFTHITLDNKVLRANKPVYLMMNKPPGVVSATRDEKHKTVVDLLDRTDSNCLHIVGRLDYNSSGLLLLTNDGRWSRQLTSPEEKVIKLYRVKLEKPLTQEMVEAFAQGMYFAYEDITTRPAKLCLISPYVAEVSLVEGKYHQIKRMFGRFQNTVLKLQRIAIGKLSLDPALSPGQSRELTPLELNTIFDR